MLQERIHAGVEVYSDFSDSDPDDDDMDKDSAERYRAAKKQQRRLLASRRGPDSDEFGPIVKGGSEYDSHHSRGGSLAGKDSIFDAEGDSLLAKVGQFAPNTRQSWPMLWPYWLIPTCHSQVAPM